jgi:hypothetical protein
MPLRNKWHHDGIALFFCAGLREMMGNMPTERAVILPASPNPRSVLYRDILGVDDLDRMTEDFNPK